MDERKAIQRLKQGDIGGLEYLVSHHQLKAVYMAYLITRDARLAEEIVQEVCSYRRTTLDTARPFEPWFLRSVVIASVKSTIDNLLHPTRCHAHFKMVIGRNVASRYGDSRRSVARCNCCREPGICG